MVKIIMSQTDMSHERVVTELERTNYDLKRVIRDYMRGGDSEVKDCAVSDAAGAATATATAASSTNQLRFSEIRNFMDKSSEMYYRRKEMERIYNEVLEKKRAAAGAGAGAPDSKL
jgi:activator of HSP90 ATPase